MLRQHENDLIIIDQPEDDLDNQTIYQDVIKENFTNVNSLAGELVAFCNSGGGNIFIGVTDNSDVAECQLSFAVIGIYEEDGTMLITKNYLITGCRV